MVTAVARVARGLARSLGSVAAATLLIGSLGLGTEKQTAVPSTTELAGVWIGYASHNGETAPVVLHLETSAEGGLQAKMSTPDIHVWEYPLGPVSIDRDQIRINALAMTLVYDGAARTLTGIIPPSLVPVYSMQVTFRRTPNLDRKPRPEAAARVATPVWVFDAAAPIWADAAFGKNVVIVGADDGQLHALDARSGKSVWAFRAGGAIRARPTLSGDNIFVPADDGFLYKLNAKSGEQRWRVRVVEQPIVRLQISNQKSRYDFRASAATLMDSRLYVGTQDGHVLALDSKRGSRLWDFAAGDSVLSTPLVGAGRG